MKGTALAITLVLAISIMIGWQSIKLAEANPFIDMRAAPIISLVSPLNMTYTENVTLNFIVRPSESWVHGPGDRLPYGVFQELNSVNYYIDGKLRGSIVANSDLYPPFRYSASLTNLQEGQHSLTVTTNSEGWYGSGLTGGVQSTPADSSSLTVNFTLTQAIAADTALPIIEIVSPINKTYGNEVLLHLNITAVSDCQELSYAGYALDGRDILISNSLVHELNWSKTLEGLEEGTHTLKVFVSSRNYFIVPPSLEPDSYHIYSEVSDTITFTVGKPFLTTLVTFPTTLVIVSVSAIVVVVFGLLVYFKKRKQ